MWLVWKTWLLGAYDENECPTDKKVIHSFAKLNVDIVLHAWRLCDNECPMCGVCEKHNTWHFPNYTSDNPVGFAGTIMPCWDWPLGMLSAWGLHFYSLSLANFGFFQNFSTWVHLPQITMGSIYWIFCCLLGTAVNPTSTLSSTLTPDRKYIIHSRCSIKTCLPLSSTSVHLTLMSTLRRRY